VIAVDVELPLSRFPLKVSLSLGGGVTALMGPSGSGKTSLLETLAGLRSKARGRILFDGDPWLDTAFGRRVPPNLRRVGYVPQDAGLFPHLTALENVRFGARGTRDAVESALETLEIRSLATRYPASLSGGEKQRVALARALATRPRLLLLDEPLASLDVALKERILPFLVRIRDEWKVPCLYVTHNVGEALALAERLVVLKDGSVESFGAPMDLLSAPSVAREAEGGLENFLHGRVVAHDPDRGVTRVGLDEGLAILIPLLERQGPESRVTLAVRAEDILVATAPVQGVSARNVYAARILSLERTGFDVTLRCALMEASSVVWLVRVTPGAVEALGLGAGSAVWLAIKSHSVRAV
jgi:molybdate transport system ATP-binding protein